jgi:DNA-directed RNA polymerase subunit RPC12/RpoP
MNPRASAPIVDGAEKGLKCPNCAKTFLIGPEFVMDIVATGRSQRNDRAEVRCRICGHTWWSKHREALRKGRAIARAQRASR